jgi:hypothetical protein
MRQPIVLPYGSHTIWLSRDGEDWNPMKGWSGPEDLRLLQKNYLNIRFAMGFDKPVATPALEEM